MKQSKLTAKVALIVVGIIVAGAVLSVPQLCGQNVEQVETLPSAQVVQTGESPSGGELAASVEPPTSDRDPFSTTETMHELAGQTGPVANSPSVALVMPMKLPSLRVRGFLADGIRPSLALLEVEDADVYLVRQGDRMHVPTKSGVLELSIREVSTFGVRVEVFGTGHMMAPR